MLFIRLVTTEQLMIWLFYSEFSSFVITKLKQNLKKNPILRNKVFNEKKKIENYEYFFRFEPAIVGS